MARDSGYGTAVQGGAEDKDLGVRRRVGDLLAGVAPDRLAERLVAEAERLTGEAAALYIVEVEGQCLVRVVASEDFPRELDIPHTVGMELTRETEPGMRAMVRNQLGRPVTVQPLWIGPRAQVVLVVDGARHERLAALVREGGAAIDLANRCTDVFHRARRIHRAQAAAELQKDLLPPSIAIVEGAQVANAIMPAYEVGGDLCDWAQNPGQTRIAIADAVGKGGLAMSLSALALGALRSSRRCRDPLVQTVLAVDREIRALGRPESFLTAVLAEWEPSSSTVSWIRLGHPRPLLVDRAGRARELDGAGHRPLGLLDDAEPLEVLTQRLEPGEQFLLYSDGVTERRLDDDTRFGLDGLRNAVDASVATSATATVRAILDAVHAAAPEKPSDDATVVSLRRDDRDRQRQ